jgi:peptide/nickel transport system permease protein
MSHLLRALAVWIPTLVLVLLAIYALAFFGAGDPIKLIFLRAPGDVAYDPARIESIRASVGLDRPFLEQFLGYLWKILHGNFGNSLTSGRPVTTIIAEAAPVSMQLGLLTILVTILIGVPLGLISAFHERKLIDHVISSVSLFFWAIPPYVLGPLLMVGMLTLMPRTPLPLGWGGLLDVKILLPIIVLALQPIALIQRQTRAAVLETLTENYVRTARAKGLSEFVVATRHILRPVLVPIVTQLGLILISFINGAIFVEVVFSLPGLGRLSVQALTGSDYPVILAIALIGAIAVMTANLLVDLLYVLLDPRAKVEA